MADTPTINATSLTPIVAGAITSDYQVTIYDQSGNAGRAALADIVAAANTLNGCVCVKTIEIDLTSAEILALASSPITAIPAPDVNQYIEITGAVCEYTYGTATYSGGGNIQIGPNAGPQFYFNGTVQAAASRFVRAVPTVPTGADSNVEYAGPIYIYMLVDPTTGDGTMVIRLTYMVHTRTV
jgi:hypothetical protein